METLFTIQLNRMSLRYNMEMEILIININIILAAPLKIGLSFDSAMTQKAGAMPANFKMNNIAFY